MRYATLFLKAILLLTAALSMRSLWHQGFFTSHDGWHQVARLYHFDQLIRIGQVPPRYSFNLLNGYGYPLFLFSYHLPWMLAEPFLLMGMSIFDAIKIVFFVGFLASGLTMYIWQRNLWGALGGVTATFLYLWAPYRFSNIFVRAAIGEATSYLFIPVVFFTLWKLSSRVNYRSIAMGALGIAGLILSHAMIFFFIGPALMLYLIVLLRSTKTKVVYLRSVGLTFILGLLLSAYYLVPIMRYQPLTIFSQVQRMFFTQQFPPLSKLIYSTWGYGTALSGPGEMSFQVGLSQWLVISIATIFILKRWRSVNFHLRNLHDQLGLVFLVSFSLAVILMLEVSKPFWLAVGRLVPIDFPWRFLTTAVLAGSSLAGYLVSRLRGKLSLLLAVVFIVLAIVGNRNHLRVNQYTDIPLSLYIASERTTNTYDEYLPKWVRLEEVTREKKSGVIFNQKTEIRNYQQLANMVSYDYSSIEMGEMTIRNLYFPGVKLYVDNRNADFSYSNGGFIQFSAPEGIHKVTLKIEKTLIELFAEALSILGLVVCFRFILIERKKQ